MDIVHFHTTPEGAKNAGEYLKSINRLSDFWFHPSSIDIINYANKLWNELNLNIKIINFQKYRDGGTIEITTDKGVFCFDGRIRSTTKGRLYDGYPKKDNSNIIENSDVLEQEIIKQLKSFKNDFYQNSIDCFINSKQK